MHLYRESKPGLPMIIKLTIVDVTTCEVLQNAAVDIWHCDASGVYSAFTNEQNQAPANSTFLRGIQLSDANGLAEVFSIYPGWYEGRDTHVHVKVRLNGTLGASNSSKFFYLVLKQNIHFFVLCF
jgi:protocatechuate 3,4-dioxygenase beta subunit